MKDLVETLSHYVAEPRNRVSERGRAIYDRAVPDYIRGQNRLAKVISEVQKRPAKPIVIQDGHDDPVRSRPKPSVALTENPRLGLTVLF